jgi:predicted nucleic acid-binding protein
MPVSAGAAIFDTKVLVTIASGGVAKADRAEAVVAAGGVISVQVLNELANVARPMRMSWTDTHVLLDLLRGLLTVPPFRHRDTRNRVAARRALRHFDF